MPQEVALEANISLKGDITRLKVKSMNFYYLENIEKNNNLDYAILSTHNFYLVLYYSILSKAFGFKTILNYVEYCSAIKKNKFRIWKKD